MALGFFSNSVHSFASPAGVALPVNHLLERRLKAWTRRPLTHMSDALGLAGVQAGASRSSHEFKLKFSALTPSKNSRFSALVVMAPLSASQQLLLLCLL